MSPLPSLLSVGLIATQVACSANQQTPRIVQKQMLSEGLVWTYSVAAPKSSKPLPLVLILHGAGGTGEHYLTRDGWAAEAKKEGFIALAPDGQPAFPNRDSAFLTNPRLWNTGQLQEGSPRSKVDDLSFLRKLLAQVESDYSVDRSRVYVTGHSNGAGMTFRVAAAMSDQIAAIAPVASHVWFEPQKLSHPMPTLYIIGTEDPLVPPAGGESKLPWSRKPRYTPPVADSLEMWAQAMGVSTAPSTVQDDEHVRVQTYGSTMSSAFIKAVYIKGQGHGWAGGSESGLPDRLIGPKVDFYDATGEIWKFLKQFRLQWPTN